MRAIQAVIGPNGNTRQVMSDMFFAEVRPFDEAVAEIAGEEGVFKKCLAIRSGAQQNDARVFAAAGRSSGWRRSSR